MHAQYIPSEAFSRQLLLTLQMILNAEYGIFLLPCSDRDDWEQKALRDSILNVSLRVVILF